MFFLNSPLEQFIIAPYIVILNDRWEFLIGFFWTAIYEIAWLYTLFMLIIVENFFCGIEYNPNYFSEFMIMKTSSYLDLLIPFVREISSIRLPVDISFTNAALMLFFIFLVSEFLVFALLDFKFQSLYFVPTTIQVFFTLYYHICVKILTANVTNPNYRNIIFPYAFCIGLFILYSNVIGLFSCAFSVTANFFIIFSFVGPFLFFLFFNVLDERGLTFLRNFFPFGAPTWLLPLIVPIEVLSILMRPVSLILRLGCNILSGHCIMHVVGGALFELLTFTEYTVSSLFFIVAFYFLLAFLTLAEFTIGLIQVYIFLTILSICCNDIFGGHLPVIRKLPINFWHSTKNL